jgi:hypothetical protein
LCKQVAYLNWEENQTPPGKKIVKTQENTAMCALKTLSVTAVKQETVYAHSPLRITLFFFNFFK